MKRNNLLRFIIVVLVVAWSIYEIYPPTGRDVIEYFNEKALVRDDTFKSIVATARSLRQEKPERGFANLKDAVGTNDITKYFPQFEAKNKKNPSTYVLNKIQRGAAGRIKLGIDLQGGTSFTLEMNTNQLATIETITNSLGKIETRTNYSEIQGALAQAVEVLRKRVDSLGVAEPVIQPYGENQIVIQLPGLSEADREEATKNIQKAAFLEFRLVHPESQALLERNEIPPGYQVMTQIRTLPDGREQAEKYVVKKKAELTGGIKQSGVTRNDRGQPEIAFRLDDKAAEVFGRITSENVGHYLAVVLDGELQTAPRIKVPIIDGSGVIEGDYTDREAFALATVLQNPLRAPLHPVYSSDVDPTLGKASIRSGVTASVVGVILVAGFMLVYYLAAGFVANAALMLNIVILLGVMCYIRTTLTLPGIAGIVLTLGMAVDANVLIYERIREELAAGKSIRGALSAGYDKAFGTIFDSNLTTLISSIILIIMGTGTVKGFGVTLTIGVCVSMFTALIVTRLIFDWLIEKGWLKTIRMWQFPFLHGTKFDFMKLAVPAFVASWLLIVIGNGYGIFGRGKDVLGVEFSGGTTLVLNVDQNHLVDDQALNASIAKTGVGQPLISYQRELGTGTRTLRLTIRSFQEKGGEDPGKRVLNQLQADFKESNFTLSSSDQVGPTVGAAIRDTAILAGIIAMFGILVYVAFRYEFSFAVGAVVAIIHDLLMTSGWYFLAGRELNATTVAAFLTIIGFSINDTIVIFDRIREDLKLGVRGTFREVMNQALNQTLSRTIITSGTVFLATASLYVFGGGPINDFALAFLVGILTGTYSSIYIASAIVLWWHKGQRPHIGGGQLNVPTAATVTPATARP
jgi:SecD/SecF fusion protein